MPSLFDSKASCSHSRLAKIGKLDMVELVYQTGDLLLSPDPNTQFETNLDVDRVIFGPI